MGQHWTLRRQKYWWTSQAHQSPGQTNQHLRTKPESFGNLRLALACLVYLEPKQIWSNSTAYWVEDAEYARSGLVVSRPVQVDTASSRQKSSNCSIRRKFASELVTDHGKRVGAQTVLPGHQGFSWWIVWQVVQMQRSIHILNNPSPCIHKRPSAVCLTGQSEWTVGPNAFGYYICQPITFGSVYLSFTWSCPFG